MHCPPRHIREGPDSGPLTSRDIAEMRAFLRLRNREQTWAYVERKNKELYLRIAIKKLSEEDSDFEFLKPSEQINLVVERAKFIAMKQANDENEFYARDAEGNILDDEGKIVTPDEDVVPARFGDGTAAEVGESRQRGRLAGTEGQKTFGKKR
jgi:hypothetical protein